MPQVSRYVATLTKLQQNALKRIYDRGPIYVKIDVGHERPISYRQFRRTVRVVARDCAMVEWCGMWLGIELDGYTHS